MKKVKFFLIMLLTIILLYGCNNSNDNSTLSTSSSKWDGTGVRENFNYVGNDCIYINDRLYFQQDLTISEVPSNAQNDYFEKLGYSPIGTVSKAVDAVPKNNGESAIAEAGSLILKKEDKENSIYVYIPSEHRLYQYVKR